MLIPVDNCSSCMACLNVCTRKAIRVIQNVNGFYRPEIDEQHCIKCGMCEQSCPSIHLKENPFEKIEEKVFAAYNLNEEIRKKSSSGGIFSAIAEYFVDRGGVAVGVAEGPNLNLKFYIAENKYDLEKLRGSKYFQANPGFIYKEVKEKLDKGVQVLFSGTPCQIAALYSVLRKKYENLLTVDLICAGVPSQKVYEKYIKEKYHRENGIRTIFRDKASGWKGYSMTDVIEYPSRRISQKRMSERAWKNIFFRTFMARLCKNDSCNPRDCKYGRLPRIADITLGDFWGIENFHPEMDDNKGTSVVIVNTEHGKKFLEKIKDSLRLCESKMEYVIQGVPAVNGPFPPNENRDNFFEKRNDYSLKKLLKLYDPKPNLIVRGVKKIRKFIHCLTTGV